VTSACCWAKGDGTFGGATNFSDGQSVPIALVLADFNGDGKLDLAIANLGNGAGTGGLSVMMGNGNGTFGTPTQYGKSAYTIGVTAADMNGDGKLDLVAVGYDTVSNNGFVSVLLGNGDGTFQSPINLTTGYSSFYNVIVADYNGDGKLDVAAGDYNGGVNVFLGNGNGTLQSPLIFGAATAPANLISGDFNADGAPDIAAENVRDSTVSVLLNTAGTFIATTSSLNPSGVGQSVTFTANITGSINTTTTPTGSVTFYDGSNAIGTATLKSGSGSISTSSLAQGTHTITAQYSGDTNFVPHTGAALSQSVLSGPLVVLSPTSLTFGNQNVGTTSGPQTVTLSNTGVASLSITSITTSGDFAQTNTCGASVAAGASCSISVTFTPTTTGTRTGTLSVNDNAPGSPQTVSLSGTGVAPSVQLSPTSLSYATQLVKTMSAPQVVTLTNNGTATLNITKINIGGKDPADFNETNTCGTTVAIGASCSISVIFQPQSRGSRSGTLKISDNAIGSPQTANLTGTGTVVSLSATSINFGSEPVGKTSAPNTFTLTNTGQTTLSITSITLTGANPGDFAQTNTCGTSVAASGSCTISVTFTPTAKGSRSASVSIADSGGGSPQAVSLSGNGT
jgi:hypothetical protein